MIQFQGASRFILKKIRETGGAEIAKKGEARASPSYRHIVQQLSVI
jgi:hypothetical protein